jgi:hypothetical protein
MFTEDKLFLALIVLPVLVAGARFLESKAEMDQIALANKPPVVAQAAAPVVVADDSRPAAPLFASRSTVHRF